MLIDDLVTRGTTEPYRMFTSRAEYRLALRADNADQRLTPLGAALGCVGAGAARGSFRAKAAALDEARALVRRLPLTPDGAPGARVWRSMPTASRRSAADLLAYPGIDAGAPGGGVARAGRHSAPEIAEQLEIDGKYAGYLERQEAEIRAFRKDEALKLPRDLDYGAIGSLSTEVRSKLGAARPETLGAAARISGVTPAALIALLRHVARRGGGGMSARPPVNDRPVRTALGREGFARLFNVSRETLARLDAYVGLLAAWNRRINLVGAQHAGRCLAAPYSRIRRSLCRTCRPGRGCWSISAAAPACRASFSRSCGVPEVHLVESDQRKGAFPAEAARVTGAGPKSIRSGADKMPRLAADLVTARAVAASARLLDMAHHS